MTKSKQPAGGTPPFVCLPVCARLLPAALSVGRAGGLRGAGGSTCPQAFTSLLSSPGWLEAFWRSLCPASLQQVIPIPQLLAACAEPAPLGRSHWGGLGTWGLQLRAEEGTENCSLSQGIVLRASSSPHACCQQAPAAVLTQPGPLAAAAPSKPGGQRGGSGASPDPAPAPALVDKGNAASKAAYAGREASQVAARHTQVTLTPGWIQSTHTPSRFALWSWLCQVTFLPRAIAHCSLCPSAVLEPGSRDEQRCEDAAACSCSGVFSRIVKGT